MNTGVWFALGAAALFGLSTPLAKLLLGSISPVLLGGLLYLGSGLGLLIARLWRDQGWQVTGLKPGEWPWLAGAIVFGGVLGPVALMLGLRDTAGSTASLLLNLEAVLTAVLAWVAFKENADRRVVVGMLAIVAGGAILSWPGEGADQTGLGWGAGFDCAGVPVLGDRQQPHAQGIGIGCPFHRQQQGAGGRLCECLDRCCAGRCLASVAHRAGSHGGGAAGYTESVSCCLFWPVRRLGHRTDGGILLGGAVHRRPGFIVAAGRIGGRRVLVGLRAHGLRCVAASDRAT